MVALEKKAPSREEGGRGFENGREQRKRTFTIMDMVRL